jgi:putative RecB family exonuclease
VTTVIDIPEPAPIPDDEGPQRFSVSQGNTFAKCQRRWWWQYIAGVDDPPGDDARRGSLVHTVLEHLCLLPPAERTVDAAARIAFEHWHPEPGEPPDPPGLRRVAWRNVLRALNLPEVVTPDTVATEVPVKVVLDGVPLTGYIDRVAHGRRGLEVDDYKDGKRPTHSGSRSEKKRQVIIYAAALPLVDNPATGDSFPRPTDASLIYTAAGVVDRYPVTDRAVETAVGWLRGQWDVLRTARATGDFPVNPSALCSWCPAVAMCPEGLDAVAARARNPEKSLGAHGRRALAAEAAEDAVYRMMVADGLADVEL